MDGLELCRLVRQLDLPDYVYIVFVTGRHQKDELVSAMDAGADDFLSKPIHKHEFLARLSAGRRILQLQSWLSRLASHDALTGLLVRRPFNEIMEREWHRAQRYRLPLFVLMIDVDFFKQVNDTHGDPAGDEVIRSCGRKPIDWISVGN